MTSTAKRILSAVGSIPVGVAVFWISFVAIDDFTHLGEGPAVSAAFASAAVVMIGFWLLVWGRMVRWSRAIIAFTGILVIVCFLLPIASQVYFAMRSELLSELLLLTPVIGWGAWMALTARYWPMEPEQLDRALPYPLCLSCGYSLAGLRSSRCPECGDEPPLDELFWGNVGEVR